MSNILKEIIDHFNNNHLDKAFNLCEVSNEKKITHSSSINLDKKNVFLFNKGDIVSIGKLDGNLFKPNKILI